VTKWFVDAAMPMSQRQQVKKQRGSLTGTCGHLACIESTRQHHTLPDLISHQHHVTQGELGKSTTGGT
jgi:hypothetical protein